MKVLNKHSCVIPDYPVSIKVSEKKRPVYWKRGQLLPKKYPQPQFIFNPEGILIDASNGEKMIKNIKTVGKPRLLSINAQKIYIGIHHSVRSKIVSELHDVFNKAFKAQFPPIINLGVNKILVTLHFFDVYSVKLPDLDNLANLFVKCGIDCLTTANNPNQTKGGATHKLGILPDDKMIYIPHIVVEFTHVADPKDRKLEFNLYEVTPDFTVDELINNELCNITNTLIQP